MAKQTAPAITSSKVQRAAVELESMKRSLAAWLKYRKLNDAVIAGKKATKVPPGLARQLVQRHRDLAVEQELANRLYTLLSELDVKGLPDPGNPNAAVLLAQIAIAGGTPAMGGLGTTHPWLWPVLIVGGLLLAVTTAVKSYADLAKEREHYACIQAGACTDYGFWLKAGGVTVLGWFVWKELGVGDVVKRLIKKRGT